MEMDNTNNDFNGSGNGSGIGSGNGNGSGDSERAAKKMKTAMPEPAGLEEVASIARKFCRDKRYILCTVCMYVCMYVVIMFLHVLYVMYLFNLCMYVCMYSIMII